MPTGLLLGVLLAVLPAVALADVSVPDTPPGRALAAWLSAFNSGDRGREEAFNETYSWETDLDSDMRWRAETGGYDLLDIYTNDQTHILFRLKTKANGGEEIGTIQVSAAEPRVLTELGTFRIRAGSRFDAVTFDDGARARVVDQVSNVLNASYLFQRLPGKCPPHCGNVRAVASTAPFVMAGTSHDSSRGICRKPAETNIWKGVLTRRLLALVGAEAWEVAVGLE